jgi:glutathione synthase
MKVAFQMDENINFETDTTFVLIKEAQRRGMKFLSMLLTI